MNQTTNRLKRIYLLIVFLGIGASNIWAQPVYIPLVLSGQNADCIVENTNDLSGASPIDANDWAFYSSEVQNEGSIAGDTRSIITATNVNYDLSPYSANNTFLLRPDGKTSLYLKLLNPLKTSEIWLLGTAANGSNTIQAEVHYEDGSSSVSTQEFPDWYQNSSYGVACFGMGRINITNGDIEERNNFSLFERILPADPTKKITGITISYHAGSGYVAIFAASAFYTSSVRDEDYSCFLVSDSHLDTQWNWELKQTIGSYIPNTLSQNFSLFDSYPHFQFNFESAVHYKWMKEYYPAEWERLKLYVTEGHWHISGGAVNANDVMVPSAESIIRNFLYGQTFYKREFGRKGGSDVMLPDCFGFPYSLPSLAKHCGMMGFHTAKLAWGSAYDYDKLFTFGRWRGVDGSEILALLKPGPYDAHEEFRKDLSYDGELLAQCVSNKQEIGIPSTFRYVGPRSDRGGGLDDETVSWLEKSVTGLGPVKVKLVSPDSVFASITDEQSTNLPVWNNELPMRTHGVGAYSSQTILKYWNRKNELLAGATEQTAVMSEWMGLLKYPAAKIEQSWFRILWHQFHDDITGTSIPKANTYAYNDAVLNQQELSESLINSVGAVSRKLNTNTDGTAVVVYNPLSIVRTDLVEASLKMDQRPNSLIVTDGDGTIAKSQILGYDSNSNELKFLFVATSVPSLGYAIYDVKAADTDQETDETLKVTTTSLENSVFNVTVNANGDVAAIYDKQQQRELLDSPIRLELLQDVSESWPAWEITSETDFSDPYAYVDEGVSISVVESGPLRAALKITRSKRGSEYVQYLRLCAQTSPDRIDFVNEVDWQTHGTLLKAVFPLDAQNDSAKFDLSLGAINRPNSTAQLYEVAGHQWADITDNDGSYGVSILNDCKYGWDKPSDNILRLSLIHTPEVGGSYTYQRYQDLGLNKFTFSFYRHMGDWNESTPWEGEKLNQPLMAFQTPKHEGGLGKSFGFAQLNTPKVAVKALKKAEESDDLIVRVYELTGEDQQNVEIKFPSKILSASETNGIEEKTGSASFADSTLVFDIGGFHPKTFALKLEAPEFKTDLTPKSNPVALVYNIDVMSSDGDRADGAFGDTNFAYPTELLADSVVSEGIQFNLGPRDDGKLNAIRCEGQTISLSYNEGENKKLYLLAASTKASGATGDFGIDQESYTLSIGYFTGSVGQWSTEFAEGFYKNEDVAFTATHRHNTSSHENELYNFLYMFKYVIPVNEGVQELKLPDNPDIIVFAATLSDNVNDDVVPVTEITSLPEFTDIESLGVEPCNPQLKPLSVSASGQTNDSESAEMVTDNDPFTKWCDNSSSEKWIELDLGRDMKICQWQVIHAAIEGDDLITSDFSLQRYSGGNWLDVDNVFDNAENKTNRIVEPFVASKVRLKVNQAQQNSNDASRIYEFHVYGSELSTGTSDSKIQPSSWLVYPNPLEDRKQLTVNVVEQGRVCIYSMQGVLMKRQLIEPGTTVINTRCFLPGTYVVCFSTDREVLTQKLIVN